MTVLALLITLGCVSVILLGLLKVVLQIEELRGRAHHFAEDFRWQLVAPPVVAFGDCRSAGTAQDE